MSDFYKLHFNLGNIAEQTQGVRAMVIPDSIRGLISSKSADIALQLKGLEPAKSKEMHAATTEHAARYYTEELLKAQGSERLLAITDPASPALVPNLSIVSSERAPLTNSNVVTFEQTTHEIPVFGAKAVVELDQDDNKLLAFDGSLAAPPLLSPMAKLSPAESFEKLAAFCGAPDGAPLPGTAP